MNVRSFFWEKRCRQFRLGYRILRDAVFFELRTVLAVFFRMRHPGKMLQNRLRNFPGGCKI